MPKLPFSYKATNTSKKASSSSPEQERQRRRSKGWSRLVNHSAVAILISTPPPLSLFMVQRAARAGDPWSGDMAFPGGRKEKQDKSHLATACRELKEEVGIHLDSAPLGKLDTLWTKSHNTYRPMAVHPYVFDAPATAFKNDKKTENNSSTDHLTLSHEVATAIWIPLSTFQPAHRQHFIWRTKMGSLRMACFHYQQYKIWGLSLKMIENLMAHPLISQLTSTETGHHPTDKI